MKRRSISLIDKHIYTQRASRLILFVSVLCFVFLLESLYLVLYKTEPKELKSKKHNFVTLVGLPDLAISTEATYIRHRSMSTLFSIYKDDGSLREYFPSTFTYSHSHIINR